MILGFPDVLRGKRSRRGKRGKPGINLNPSLGMVLNPYPFITKKNQREKLFASSDVEGASYV